MIQYLFLYDLHLIFSLSIGNEEHQWNHNSIVIHYHCSQQSYLCIYLCLSNSFNRKYQKTSYFRSNQWLINYFTLYWPNIIAWSFWNGDIRIIFFGERPSDFSFSISCWKIMDGSWVESIHDALIDIIK